jgi:polyhydroxyalkanoate synthesis regulator phasin
MVLPAETRSEKYIEKLESTVNILTAEVLSLRSEVEELKKRLLAYENLHAPPFAETS